MNDSPQPPPRAGSLGARLAAVLAAVLATVLAAAGRAVRVFRPDALRSALDSVSGLLHVGRLLHLPAALLAAMRRHLFTTALAALGILAVGLVLVALRAPGPTPWETRRQASYTLKSDPMPPWMRFRIRLRCKELLARSDEEIRRALFEDNGEPLRQLLANAGYALFVTRNETQGDPQRLRMDTAVLDYTRIREIFEIYSTNAE